MRKSNDYVPKMIDIAGGEYVFQNLKGEDNAASSVNMQMEEFYAQAKDADYLVYNSTIDGNLTTVDDLLAKTVFLQILRQSKTETYGVSGKTFIRIQWIPEALSMIFMRC